MPQKSAPPSTIHFSLLHPHHKKEIIVVYLTIIGLVSYFTWQTLSIFEATIINTSNRLAATIYNKPFQSLTNTDDLSILEITTSPNLNILVTIPGNQKVGDTQEDIRFTQYPGATIKETTVYRETNKSGGGPTNIWQLNIPQPPVGNYKLVLTSRIGGTFPVSIRTTDRNDLYTKQFDRTINLKPNQQISYHLKIHKDVIHQAQLKRRFTFPQLFR